ncbi:MAG: tetratricopeptide repeat protein [Candidatus Omnitrophota bacterium]
MRPEHKKYIIENIGKKPVPEIAADLGVKERNVRRVAEKEGMSRGTSPGAKLAARTAGRDLFRENLSAGHKYTALSHAVIFTVIVAAAFVLRIAYLNQIKTNPFFVPFERGLDDYLYDNWALGIAGGNVLGNGVFYGLPLYPYFLGFIYFLFGHDVFTARVIQFFMGSLSAGLIYLIGARIFNRAVGVMAGFMMAFYAMAVYFEGFFVSAFLAVFINCVIVLVFLSILGRPSVPKFISAGILVGLSMLANASIAVFVPFAVVWIFTSFGKLAVNKRAGYAASLLAALALTIAPVTARNYMVGGDFVPITAHAGITFYAGNNPLSTGSFNLPKTIGTSVIDSRNNATVIAQQAMDSELKPSEVSRYWFNQSFRFIHDEPLKYMRLIFVKALLFWNAYEIPDILPMFFFKRFAPLLGYPLVNFSFMCPLALVGMFLCFRIRRPDVNILYYMVLSVFLSTLIYFVNSRYRLAALPYLAVFASVSLYWLYTKAVSREYLRILLFLAAAAVLAGVCHVKLIGFRESQAYNSLAIILKRQGLYDEAIKEYKKAIEIDPRYPSPYFNLGLLYMDLENWTEAVEYFRKAVDVNPEFARAYEKLGMAYLAAGRTDAAVAAWRKSLEIDPYQEDLKQQLERYSR